MGSGTSQARKPAPGSGEEAMLMIGEQMHAAETLFGKGKKDEAFQKVAEAHALFPRVPEEEKDNYSTMLSAREGKMYYQCGDFDKATEAYGKAIQTAELRISQRCRGLYLLLQRYTECMTDQVRIWEQQAAALPETEEKQRLKMYSNCELGLLRCIEMIEEGHNRRSDMLILPLTRLALLYERLKLYKKAELLMRRCQGVIIVQFGCDHPDLHKIEGMLKVLERRNEEQAQSAAIVKIQSVFRMYLQMKKVGDRLRRKMRRHVLAPPAIREERDKGEFLTKISNQLEPGMAMGHRVVDENGNVDTAEA